MASPAQTDYVALPAIPKTKSSSSVPFSTRICVVKCPAVTIVTCVKVRDGLVLGTDSMAHITRQQQFLRFYENARKLFQVGKLPMGAMSYGLGNLGNRSIESLMREFGESLEGRVSVNTVGKELFGFMKEKYDALAEGMPEDEELPALGFYLAGYSRGQVFAEEREFQLPRDSEPLTPRNKEEFGAAWRGVEAPFHRLSKGYGFLVRQRLESAGVTAEQAGELLDDLEIDVIFDGMPVQDAVDYATFILKTTIGYTTFAMDVSPCGGPLQVATILPDNGYEWLSRPILEMH